MTWRCRWATGYVPESIQNDNDEAQFAKLYTLDELTNIAREYNVLAMVKGPGYVPMQMIRRNMPKQLGALS